MSNETAKKTTRSKTSEPEAVPENEPVQVDTSAQAKTSRPKMKAKEVDLNQYITVRNGFQGMLIYISKKTGEVFEWDDFGAEQEMELGELKNAKNSSKNFFINNWFMFDDPWVIDFLGVGQYYKNTIPIDEFDELFTKSAEEAGELVRNAPEGQKRSIAYRARQLIAENAIDSLNLVKALEKELGVELIEH